MKPFTRETVTDRRQGAVRWTAVIAGALVALGTWLLLQLLLTGGALSAIDADHVDKLRSYSIGTSVGSILAPLLAMFAGGLVAGKLASYYDAKVSAFHGALVWTIASVIGVALLGSVVSSMASRHMVSAHADMALPPEGAERFVDSTLDNVNTAMKAQNAPTVEKSAFLDAARFSVNGRDTFDRASFVSRLDEKTSLSRPEAEAVFTNLGTRPGDVLTAANQLATHRERALEAADDAGKAMVAAGIGLLLCLISAIGGALLGSRLFERRRRGGERFDAPSGTSTVSTRETVHTTAPYPTVTTPE
jgi:hypothetical protein